jgi:Secretion system C-terminal sorting domain/Beta-propeller repeat
LSGGTGSATNIATIGSYQDTLDTAGRGISFIAKFNTTGNVIWGTYFGLSDGGSGARGCVCDKQNNVYIAGSVYDTGIYATPGCYKSSDGYGDHSFIAKFDSACHLKWSTYYGGDSTDDAFAIACNDSYVFITGLTNSANGIASPGAHQSVYGGGYYDAFLACFSETGTFRWSTYYGGSGDDEGNGIACDHSGNVYITGITSSSNNIATPGSYHDSIMGGSDVFLAKFGGSGALLWATYYGGIKNDGGYGVACDAAGNVYISGGTASPDNIATPGSYQSVFADSTDAFLVKFDTGTTAVKYLKAPGACVSLYPNPNDGRFVINGNFPANYESAVIRIVDISGTIVLVLKEQLHGGVLNKKFNLNLSAGTYLIKIETGDETRSMKLLIE